MPEPVELRDLRVFFVLAEELHFGRAAQRLGLSQARVSQTIVTMERRVGGRLFDRTSRRVSLTLRGERLMRATRGPYGALLRAVSDTRFMDDAVSGEIRLGLLTAVAGGRRLLDVVQEFRTRHPMASVRIVELTFADPLGSLRHGDIDVMAVRLPLNVPDLTIGPVLSREDRVLAVSRNDPLADLPSVSVEVLADHAVARPARLPPEMEDAIIPRTTPSGREIVRTLTASTLPEILAAVARGEIVHPTVALTPDFYRHPDVTYVPIIDMPPSSSALAWRSDRQESLVQAFVAVAAELLDEL